MKGTKRKFTAFIINKGYSQTGVTFLLFTVLKSPHLVVRFQFLF